MRTWLYSLDYKFYYHRLFYAIVRNERSLSYLDFLNITFIRNGLIHVKGSLSTALDFAIKKGFREIIFCGVDLDDRGHFYPSDEEGKMHATNIDTRTIKIEKYLNFIFKSYATKINFYVNSSSSLLARYIPVYKEWN